MSDKLCIDLCSGLGGFSQAFEDAGWRVVRIDNNSEFAQVPHTIIADILTYDWSALAKEHPTVVLASPPCERFSIAMPHWPKPGVGKALAVVGGCLEAIIKLRPKYWALENPKGRLRWFLGAPPNSIRLSDYGHNRSTQTNGKFRPFKPTDIWGNVPFGLLDVIKEPQPIEGLHGWSAKPKGHGWKDYNRSAAIQRAKMPLGLSQAVLEAVEPQP